MPDPNPLADTESRRKPGSYFPRSVVAGVRLEAVLAQLQKLTTVPRLGPTASPVSWNGLLSPKCSFSDDAQIDKAARVSIDRQISGRKRMRQRCTSGNDGSATRSTPLSIAHYQYVF